jgi:large subunit ribosomal protein L13
MPSPACRTFMAKPGQIDRKWYLVDADGKVLGRLATKLATILMGKHRPEYTPHVATGDFVVVVNAEKVRLTGRKVEMKQYDRYTYYPGGHKITPVAKVLERHPERVIQHAVQRMLPRNKLGRQMLSQLKVCAGPEHPHQAQRPEPLEL